MNSKRIIYSEFDPGIILGKRRPKREFTTPAEVWDPTRCVYIYFQTALWIDHLAGSLSVCSVLTHPDTIASLSWS